MCILYEDNFKRGYLNLHSWWHYNQVSITEAQNVDKSANYFMERITHIQEWGSFEKQ
jgi:hypothetical protein